MLGAFGASDDDISSRFLLLEEILETALKLFVLAGERPATHAIFVSCRILVVLLRIDAGASMGGDPDGGASGDREILFIAKMQLASTSSPPSPIQV